MIGLPIRSPIKVAPRHPIPVRGSTPYPRRQLLSLGIPPWCLVLLPFQRTLR